ncbi:MAG: phosphate acyltransferase PlsX [Acidobacteria bacterium]|nr:phosphate acyltransferase PlsX [Acidobacteriota bacterium]MBI3657408.1 phosphate acyltransferase PlsX [Acidobacteriota bacterium]
MGSIKIAVDAMGGDYAPHSEVEGAVQAARDFGIEVILVGRKDRVSRALQDVNERGNGLPIEIQNADEVISMTESAATAIRKKRSSSIRVAATLVKQGHAQAMVSAGNTGAVMVASKMILGSLDRVDRPALAAVIPTVRGAAVVLDVGANVDCKPHHLHQFALMGHIYARKMLGIEKPRIGLLSIGEEETKGNLLTKEVHKALKEASLNFIGNVEGKDVYHGKADVVVCDGFTGNVALKISEGLIEVLLSILKEELTRTLTSQVGALLSRQAFKRVKKRLDYSEFGGAPLLGVRGVSIICHGRSNANAIKNAIRMAKEFCTNDVNQVIEREFESLF